MNRDYSSQRMSYSQWNFQGIFATSIYKGWGILLVNSSYSIQELIPFLCTNSGSLVCQIISGKRFWKITPCSPIPLPISNTEPFFMILDSASPMQSLFLWVTEKKCLLSKIKRIWYFSKKNIFVILYYLTFLNFGVSKNIILMLKNNIETVRAGNMKSIKSELTKEGILPKIICM